MSRDIIQIISNSFQAERMRDLVACLERAHHHCEVSVGLEGVTNAVSNPRSKLLMLEVSGGEVPRLVKSIQALPESVDKVPVLVCLTEDGSGIDQELLATEVDDFLVEPSNVDEILLRARRLMRRFAEGYDDLDRIKRNLVSQTGMQQLVGEAPSFLACKSKIQRVATCDAPVLIIGETGTGKEMCARAVHYISARSGGTFIPVNCGAIPTDLFENELFGHEPGAFTDARHLRRGLIAEAEGGTLFLDEVDALTPAAQVKILRFLQDRQYKPLGASHYRQANTRLLAASNQDLQMMVREGRFREDLYFRMKVVSLWLPPLRERQEDILPLALHFLKIASHEYKRPVSQFSRDAMLKLSNYAWPGNVRELENMIRQAVVLAEGTVIQPGDIKLSSDPRDSVSTLKEPLKLAKAHAIEAFEREYLQDLLFACDGNITKAARVAHKERRTFFALLKKYGLTRLTRRPAALSKADGTGYSPVRSTDSGDDPIPPRYAGQWT